MAVDPKEQLIADGRLFNRPINTTGADVLITIDLDFAALQIISSSRMSPQRRPRYGGFTNLTTQKIQDGLTAMNEHSIPVASDLEFPTWISSTLSCIGPCRVTDGPTDTLIVYASTAATMQTFGRAEAVQFNYGDYIQLLNVLKDIKFQTAPFDHANMLSTLLQQLLLHQTYQPGKCDSVGRPCGVIFRVNYHGIQPAIASARNVQAQARGVYIVGRGIQRRYQFIIALVEGVACSLDLLYNGILFAVTFLLGEKVVILVTGGDCGGEEGPVKDCGADGKVECGGEEGPVEGCGADCLIECGGENGPIKGAGSDGIEDDGPGCVAIGGGWFA
ncbi:hypothetical protein GQ457_15G015070 [Hibiscus cannabinus]